MLLPLHTHIHKCSLYVFSKKEQRVYGVFTTQTNQSPIFQWPLVYIHIYAAEMFQRVKQ